MEKTMVTEAVGGDIILLHDGGAHQETMMRALANVIERLKRKGFRFVTVGELLAVSETEQKVDGPLHIPFPNFT
jgi:peptidoglycan/xylan/chitin deacetylase (PgdA/CDA1 family)